MSNAKLFSGKRWYSKEKEKKSQKFFINIPVERSIKDDEFSYCYLNIDKEGNTKKYEDIENDKLCEQLEKYHKKSEKLQESNRLSKDNLLFKIKIDKYKDIDFLIDSLSKSKSNKVNRMDITKAITEYNKNTKITFNEETKSIATELIIRNKNKNKNDKYSFMLFNEHNSYKSYKYKNEDKNIALLIQVKKSKYSCLAKKMIEINEWLLNLYSSSNSNYDFSKLKSMLENKN